MKKLWGGAFSQSSDLLVDRFGHSMESDLRFWREDVQASIAHARMLGESGILAREESATLLKGLATIEHEGTDSLPKDVEDIHAAVEARLFELIGPLAGKLHTARSRNDQVAADTRLWLRGACKHICDEIKALQSVLLRTAASHVKTVMPGYTHQQPAQPISLAIHQLAHFWALQRDGWRMEFVKVAGDFSPLGASALAGTGFPIDRLVTAKELGFAAPIPNALDATSDRSFVLDALHVSACTMIDLSRIAQELILWSGPEYGFIRLSDAVTTGSSIMPQKRNPDMAELIRGRTGRAIGNWTSFASTMKALPLGYNRDTQDDKPALFDSFDLTRDSLQLATLMLESATWDTKRLAVAAEAGFSSATEIADELVRHGLAFRDAHEIVGKAVLMSEGQGRFTPEAKNFLAEKLDSSIVERLTGKSAALEIVMNRRSLGSTGRQAMGNQIRHAKRLLKRPGFPSIY